MQTRVSRRALLAAGGSTAVTVLAGCSGGETAGEPSGNSQDGANEESAANPAGIDDGTRPALGPESAPVTVTVFQDYSCPHCRTFKKEVAPKIVRQYVDSGDVRYLHADFPIPVHERWSYAIASAAYAVFEEAGNDAFWSFKDEIYTHQGDYSLDVVETVADDIADVGATARAAADENRYRDRIEADRDRGTQWGVSGTPTVFVGDETVEIERLFEVLDEQIE